MDYKTIKKEFDSLDEKEQWEWLLKIDFKDKIQINLDNDSTDIYFLDDESEDAELMYFKSDIGNRQGVNYLLEALGFNVEDV